jgi:hypothetical protein
MATLGRQLVGNADRMIDSMRKTLEKSVLTIEILAQVEVLQEDDGFVL